MVIGFNNSTSHALVLVLQTTLYAGNFERELVAFCTGELGECEVGQQEAEQYNEEVTETDEEGFGPFEDVLDHFPDDHGCHRPCSIYDDAALGLDNGYQSIIIFFQKAPTQKQIDLLVSRAQKFASESLWGARSKEEKENLKITGYYVLCATTTVVASGEQKL